MAYKRLIGVIPVKHGQVVKSYGYRFWRPAGDLVTAMRNLERWNADEILVIDISRRHGLDPEIPKLIKKAGIATPLSYGGGVRTVADALMLMDAGCERFVIETLVFDAPEKVLELADTVGAQALIASVPLTGSGETLALDHGYAQRFPVSQGRISTTELCRRLNELPVAEVMVTAMEREGTYGSFDLLGQDLKDKGFLSGINKGIIWFGGLSGRMAGTLLKDPQTIGVAFGNVNTEKELALPLIRNEFTRAGAAHEVRTPLLR